MRINNPDFNVTEISNISLKAAKQAQLGWSVRRELSKINYHIHTDAIKHNLIPATMNQIAISQMTVLESIGENKLLK